MAEQGDKKEKKEKEPFLHLDISAPDKEPDRETYKVIAEIWLSRWVSKSPRVQIRIDGSFWQGEEFYPLDQQRCLTAHIAGLEPGVHAIVVVSEDGRHRNVKPINIPKPEAKKRAEKLIIHRVGRSGKYLFSITAISGDENPVAGAAIRIVDPKAKRPVRDVKTESDGSHKFSLEFDEAERIINLILLDTAYSEEIRLLGPKEKPGW